MKLLFKILTLLLPGICFGQNWELFNSYDHYNYKQDTAQLVNSVCFADSFEVIGGDTLYFINRIVERNNINNLAYRDTAQLNRWQFLQRKIKKRSDGWYAFFDPGSVVINPKALPGNNWLYDTLRNITATVTLQDTSTLFGVVDSVKFIVLSNSADTIIISRSYGIIRFPADTSDHLQTSSQPFKLQGIQTRAVGEHVLTFNDIYNFDVGDVFVYDIEYVASAYTTGTTWKYRILAKQQYSDSIVYSIYSIQSSAALDPHHDQPVTTQDTFPIIFRNTAQDISNAYPGQFSGFVDLFGGTSYYGDTGEQQQPYYSFNSYVIEDVYGIRCKKLGVNNSRGMYDSIQGSQMISSLAPGWLFSPYYCEVCEGVGHVHYYSTAFEGFYQSAELKGYIKNGITYGNVPDDDQFFLGVTESIPLERTSFMIYPNLVSERLLVQSTTSLENASYSFAIVDLNGRQLLQQHLSQSRTIVNCKSLPPAMYIWRVNDVGGNIISSGKIIHQ